MGNGPAGKLRTWGKKKEKGDDEISAWAQRWKWGEVARKESEEIPLTRDNDRPLPLMLSLTKTLWFSGWGCRASWVNGKKLEEPLQLLFHALVSI